MHHYWPVDMVIGSIGSLKGIEGDDWMESQKSTKRPLSFWFLLCLSPNPTCVQVSHLPVTWSPFTAIVVGSHLFCHIWTFTWPSPSLRWQESLKYVQNSAAHSLHHSLKRHEQNHLLWLIYFFLWQGVYARHLLGNASAPNAAHFGQGVEPLAKIALQVAQRLLALSLNLLLMTR